MDWCYGDERDYAAVFVFAGLHWRADFLERSEGVVGVRGQMSAAESLGAASRGLPAAVF